MKIISLLLSLTLLLTNCSKTVLYPIEVGYALVDLEFAQDSALAEEYNKNDLLIAKGYYKLDGGGNATILKQGQWISYHENGQLESKGLYGINHYTECCASGPCEQVYNYKYGHWEYYYPNGQLKAGSEYDMQKLKVDTNCGGDEFLFGLTSNKWNFYDLMGNSITPSTELIKSLETVKTEYLGLEYFAPDSTRTNIELIKTGYNIC